MITKKDFPKLISLSVVVFTMAFVCSVFLNYLLDVKSSVNGIHDNVALIEINSRITMARFTFLITFIMLGLTTVFLLVGAIKSFIKAYQPIMGMLKALGYSNMKIALDFYKFGVTIFISLILGYGLSMIIAPIVYDSFNVNSLVKINMTFKITTIIIIVIIPTIFITLLAIFGAYRKLKAKPLDMILNVESYKTSKKIVNYQEKLKESNYLKNISKIFIKTNKKISILIIFASVCFSAMLQMPITLWKSGFTLIGAIIMVVSAITLGCGILYIGLSIALKDSQRSISIMKMCGYDDSDIEKVCFNEYKYRSYIGFIIGTIYQFLLVMFIMGVYKKSYPEFNFDVVFRFDGLVIVLVLFIAYYNFLIWIFKKNMKKISYNQLLKE